MDSIKAQNEVAPAVDQYVQQPNAHNEQHHQQPSTSSGQSQLSESNPFLEASNSSNYNDISENNNNALAGFDQQQASERNLPLSATPTPVHEPPSPTHAASHNPEGHKHHMPGHHATSAHSTTTTHTGEHRGLLGNIEKHLPGHGSNKAEEEAKLQEQIKQGDIPPPEPFNWSETLKKEGFEHDQRLFAQKPEPIPIEKPGHHEPGAVAGQHGAGGATGQHEAGAVAGAATGQHGAGGVAAGAATGQHEAGATGQNALAGDFEAQSAASEPEAAGTQRVADENPTHERSTQPLAEGQSQPIASHEQPAVMHLGGSTQVDVPPESRELNSRAHSSAHMPEGILPIATLKPSHGIESHAVTNADPAPVQSNTAPPSLPASNAPSTQSATDVSGTTTAPKTSATTAPETSTTTAPETSTTTAPKTSTATASETSTAPETSTTTAPKTSTATTASETSAATTSPLAASSTAPTTTSSGTTNTQTTSSATTSAHTAPSTTTTSATSTASAHTSSATTSPTTDSQTASHTSHDTTNTTATDSDEHSHGLRAKLKHLKDKITGHHHETDDAAGPSTAHKGPIETHKDKPSTTAASDPPHPAQAVTQDTKHHFKLPHILYHPPKGRENLDAEKHANAAAAEEGMKEMAKVKLAGAEKFEEFWDAKNKEAEANKAAGITPPPGQMAEGPVAREEGEDQADKNTRDGTSAEGKSAIANAETAASATSAPAANTIPVSEPHATANASEATNAAATVAAAAAAIPTGIGSVPATTVPAATATPLDETSSSALNTSTTRDPTANATVPTSVAGNASHASAQTAASRDAEAAVQNASATLPSEQHLQHPYQQDLSGHEQLPLAAGRLLNPQVETVLAPHTRPLLGQNCETPGIQTRDTPLLGAGCVAPETDHRGTSLLGANCEAPRSIGQSTADYENQVTSHQSSRGSQNGERLGEYTSTPELVIHAVSASSDRAHTLDVNFPTSTSFTGLATASSPSDSTSPLSQPPLRKMNSRDDSAPLSTVPLQSGVSDLDAISPLSKPPLRRMSSKVIPSAESLANLHAVQTPTTVEHQSADAHLVRSVDDQFSTPIHHMQATDFQASPLHTQPVAVMRPAAQISGEQIPLTDAHQQPTSQGLQLTPSIHEQQRTSFSQPDASPNLAPTTAFRLESEAPHIEPHVEPAPIKVSDYNFGTTFREPKTTPIEDEESESGLKGKVAHVAHAVKDALTGGHRRTLSDVPTDDGSGNSKVPNPGVHVVAHDVPRD